MRSGSRDEPVRRPKGESFERQRQGRPVSRAPRQPISLAAILRVGLALQLGAGFLLGLWLLPEGAPVWQAVLIAVALPPVATGALLALETAVAEWVDPGTPRAPLARLTRAWAGETWCHLRVFAWRQPLAAGFPEPPLARDPQRPALLLLAGYVCNRAVWRPLLAGGRLGHCNVATVDLLPVFGPIDHYVETVDAAIERLRAATGAARVTLVCHSMGGIAARAYLRRHGDSAIERVITLGSPHHGTIFGALGFGANARQMARGSAYLAQLAAGESASLRRRFVCIATADDSLIVPRASALLPEAEQHLIDGVGHLALVEDKRAWDRVVAAIAATPAIAAG
jgi:pimeloyl-ACP methyl ester carboxylesterase